MENRGEIILYQPDDNVKLEVRMENETVWLNRQQLAELFARDVKNIGKHVNNALQEELHGLATVANFATVQKDLGKKMFAFSKLEIPAAAITDLLRTDT